MIFRPFHRYETGCASYYLGCAGKGKAVIVDPLLEYVDDYLAFAESKGTTVTHVIDTHIHADHRSGAKAICERTGAVHVMHSSAELQTEFHGLRDGDTVEAGNVSIKVMHTPGHTPEGITLVVTDRTRLEEPWFLLTGDSLFVGSVGRPDLPADPEKDAGILHDSLQRILDLPRDLEIYPAHFSGSVCGAGMSGNPSSTLGFERRSNPLLQLDRQAFIKALTSDIPAKPAGMGEIIAWNRGAAATDGSERP